MSISAREKGAIFVVFFACALPLGWLAISDGLEADPNIQLPPRPKLPSPNGFELYLQAAQNTTQPTPPIDPATDPASADISAAQGAIRYGLARREAWHKGAAKGWALFEAAKQAESRYSAPYGADKANDFARLRQLARNKSAEARLYQMRGENGRAVQSALDSVEMGIDVAEDGPYIARLVAAAFVAIGIASINDTDRLPEQLSATEAHAGIQRLQELMKRRPSWVAALERERLENRARMQAAFRDGTWRQVDETADLDWRERLQMFLTSKREFAASFERLFDNAIARQKQSYRPGAGNTTPSHSLLPPGLESARFNEARETTHLNLLLLRFAIQAFHAENGRYPANLNELKGRYLKQIPMDDFNGAKPYRYTLANGKYRLWSVGPDGKDDGGKAIPPRPVRGPQAPWQKKALPPALSDSKGDIVAGENR